MYEVVKVKKHTSRQTHPCYYCHQNIEPKTTYVNLTKRGDSRLFSDHFHVDCYKNIDYNVNFFTKELSKLNSEVASLKLAIYGAIDLLESTLRTDLLDERDFYKIIDKLQKVL